MKWTKATSRKNDKCNEEKNETWKRCTKQNENWILTFVFVLILWSLFSVALILFSSPCHCMPIVRRSSFFAFHFPSSSSFVIVSCGRLKAIKFHTDEHNDDDSETLPLALHHEQISRKNTSIMSVTIRSFRSPQVLLIQVASPQSVHIDKCRPLHSIRIHAFMGACMLFEYDALDVWPTAQNAKCAMCGDAHQMEKKFLKINRTKPAVTNEE